MWTRRECTACSSSGGTGNARNLQGSLRTSTNICFRNEFENLECSMCTAVPKARRSWEGTTLSGNVRASWRDREKAGASSGRGDRAEETQAAHCVTLLQQRHPLVLDIEIEPTILVLPARQKDPGLRLVCLRVGHLQIESVRHSLLPGCRHKLPVRGRFSLVLSAGSVCVIVVRKYD